MWLTAALHFGLICSWGKQEWKGAWSDGSAEWDSVPVKDHPENADDGSFWMSMDDFCEQFDALTITRTVNTAMLSLEQTWDCRTFRGTWAGDLAGGCKNEPGWLEHNPQFIIVQRKTSTLHLSLLQEGHGQRDDMLVIGFTVFQIEENRKYRLITRHKVMPTVPTPNGGGGDGETPAAGDGSTATAGPPSKSAAHSLVKKLFKSNDDRAARKAGVRGCKSQYTNSREVAVSARLRAGTYMIVPTTFKKSETGDFLLRIYSSNPVEGRVAKSVLDRTGGCLRKPPKRHRGVLRVTVMSCANLPKRAAAIGMSQSDPDPYVVLKVEKATARSEGIRHYDPRTGTATQNPSWGVSFVFYVQDPVTAELVIEVRDDIPIFRDPLFGEVRVGVQQYTEQARLGKSWDVSLPVVPRASPLNKLGGPRVHPAPSPSADNQRTMALRLCYTDETDL
jgi:hypothetical protein